MHLASTLSYLYLYLYLYLGLYLPLPGHPVHEDAIAIEEDEGDDHEEGVPVEHQIGVVGPGESTHAVACPD